jgi:ferredoxin
VLVNDTELDEPYIEDRTTCEGNDACNVIVPDGSVFVLGDNRNSSSDSRSFGPVSVDRVVGKAWFSYWPPSDLGFVPHYEYIEISERSVASGAAPNAAAAVATPQPSGRPGSGRTGLDGTASGTRTWLRLSRGNSGTPIKNAAGSCWPDAPAAV